MWRLYTEPAVFNFCRFSLFLKDLFFKDLYRTLDKSAYQKLFFLILIQNICCGYSKEPSPWDSYFEHPKHMIKLISKKIFTSLRLKILFI